MKKLLIALALLLPVAFGAPANSIICDGATQSSTAVDQTFAPLSVWTASGFTCIQGDKQFSNFQVTDLQSPPPTPPSPAPPENTSLRLQQYTISGDEFHSVMFGGIFSAPFSVAYDVQIISGPNVFKRVSADLIGTAQFENPVLVKQLYTLDGSLIGAMSAYVNKPGTNNPFYLNGNYTALHVVDTFTANGGVANSIGNAYLQGVPEPATMALFGAGLVALAFLRRR